MGMLPWISVIPFPRSNWLKRRLFDNYWYIILRGRSVHLLHKQ
jgi:hypothetical protein